MRIHFLFALLLGFTFPAFSQHNLIPAPVQFEAGAGAFEFEFNLPLFLKGDNDQLAALLDPFQRFLAKRGIQTQEATSSENALTIELLETAMPELQEEGHRLQVRQDGISLWANQPAGIFNGLQTLRQLMPVEIESPDPLAGSVSIPTCSILDYPRFGWRGIMLDVSRHFFPVEDVKAFIDQMAQYKFNVFHWHLTDDEGWRIEIKSLPKLTEVGAWRVERFGRFGESRPYPKKGEKATYGGFYTQDEIREVVQYAQERNITIVPEIDVPGHSMAALAAYPELSTQKEPKFVNPGSKFAEWHGDGTFTMLIENTLNPADEKVYEFLDQVFTEVAELFPGEYIHMGGDECYHGFWEEDPEVQAFMKENDIENSHELQSYFVKRVEKIIRSKGKKMIGWDEILEGGLAEGAAVMSWRGMKGGIEAAQKGHPVVMSPTTYAYLDYTQGDPSLENKIYADLSLRKTYSFEPVPREVENTELILGGQGNLWTEVIPNLPFAFYMTYPRAFALAETFWSPQEKKDWESFIARTEAHFERFDASGTSISKAVYDPIVKVTDVGVGLMVQLTNPLPDTEIYYTIDNTYPVRFGKKYSEPFQLPEGDLSLRCQVFRNGEPLGRMLLIPRDDLVKRAR